MVMKRTCKFVKDDGQQCRAAPLTNSDFCFMHDPGVAKERAEARRLGGMRRRREKATSEIYDWAGLTSVGEVRRLLELTVMDTLGLENSPARSRVLASLANASLKALEVGELEGRVSALERLLVDRKPKREGRRTKRGR
jgi:hypothetical protein